jgi:hypothetical protein
MKPARPREGGSGAMSFCRRFFSLLQAGLVHGGGAAAVQAAGVGAVVHWCVDAVARLLACGHGQQQEGARVEGGLDELDLGQAGREWRCCGHALMAVAGGSVGARRP